MGEKLGFARRSDFGGIVPYFLLLRDQATWKRRFKENKVRKQNPKFIFYDFDFGGKSPNLIKRGLLVLNHFWSCLGWIPWWIFYIG